MIAFSTFQFCKGDIWPLALPLVEKRLCFVDNSESVKYYRFFVATTATLSLDKIIQSVN